jgi:ABC-2 type transport system permease protein
MEQVRMAPIPTWAFVAGKTLPYLILSQVSAMLVILAAMALFDLPMRGDWLSLPCGALHRLGTGLLVSTATDTQQMAFQAAMLIAFLPTFMLSGFIFPIASMPAALQYITTIVPARYFLEALRGVVLKGLSVFDLGVPLLAMGIYAVAVLGLSAVRLARR